MDHIAAQSEHLIVICSPLAGSWLCRRLSSVPCQRSLKKSCLVLETQHTRPCKGHLSLARRKRLNSRTLTSVRHKSKMPASPQASPTYFSSSSSRVTMLSRWRCHATSRMSGLYEKLRYTERGGFTKICIHASIPTTACKSRAEERPHMACQEAHSPPQATCQTPGQLQAGRGSLLPRDAMT